MAACMRGIMYLVSIERNALLLTRGSCVIVESRRYVRGLRRKPVRVLFPDADTQLKTTPKPQPAEENVMRQRKVETLKSTSERVEDGVLVKARINERSAAKQSAVLKDYVDGLHFERASPGDKRLARLVSVARSRTFREHQGKILLEGRRLICDAMAAGATPQMVFFSTVERLRELPLDKLKRATLVKVKFEDIKIWSDLVAPQGVLAIFARPDPSRLNFTNKGHSLPLSLICDNIRDPGNLGTILRCAAAVGCHNVLLSKGCVDVWEPKVLRGGMGAHFRLPILHNLEWDAIENHLSKSVTIHVADRSREAEDSNATALQNSSKAVDYGWTSTRVGSKAYYESWAQAPTAIVIGGETHGLSVEAVRLAEKTAGHMLYIPVVPGVDSLNSAMAASILLFEGRKQLLKISQTSQKKIKI
ncbi:rRNA methyltransferase 3A, mitochondrial isoform X2 [Betta splendens]|uniref:rRNA methyltransferase 3A, mitochondrial isoform X2 n=1 Tax=Betta splendens TaxID=158456 RepID=A0A6P7P7T7_BETSP|nr:rRNA methyltransferase 3A, mitochondrial isoform X2 [Betta splendens]